MFIRTRKPTSTTTSHLNCPTTCAEMTSPTACWLVKRAQDRNQHSNERVTRVCWRTGLSSPSRSATSISLPTALSANSESSAVRRRPRDLLPRSRSATSDPTESTLPRTVEPPALLPCIIVIEEKRRYCHLRHRGNQ